MPELNLESVKPLLDKLNAHPIYQSLRSREDLQVFMSHHIYSVWDFMSLVKYLQSVIAPTQVPWQPLGDAEVRYFINQLVLEEESDCIEVGGKPVYGSHFEHYCRAMDEIGADGAAARRFSERVAEVGIDKALYDDEVPLAARYFSETTFGLIRENKPHIAAAALAFGREKVIPGMFRRFIAEIGLSPDQAPSFHVYLNRHVHLDEDFHGPLSERLLLSLCGDDETRISEAETAIEEAICARIRFWDGVHEAIEARRAGS